jgi:hypothetical protein
MTNQADLAKVAMTDRDSFVRKFALGRLSDKVTLAKVAEGDRDPEVRYYATRRLKDAFPPKLSAAEQDNLIKIATTTDSVTKRMTAVMRITDQAALAKIAMATNIMDSTFYKMIMARITDQKLLSDMATGNKASVRYYATMQISDKKLLAKLAESDPDKGVRELARKRANPEVAEAAAKKLLVEGEERDRCYATEEVTDQVALTKAALTDDSQYVRAAAAKRITDQAALAKVAASGDLSARDSAIENITDQELLIKLATTGTDRQENYYIHRDAVARISDQAVLEKVAFTDAGAEVRERAVDRIYEQERLFKIATSHEDEYLRGRAAGNITDLTVLAKLAETSKDPQVRSIAKSLLLKAK